MSWVRITDIGSIPPREGRAVEVGGMSIAVFNLDGRFVAVENRCPHRDGPLADGIVGGDKVTCPLHNWRICLETGRVAAPSDQPHACVRTFDVRVEDGVILLALEAAKAA
jgi:nitrite reductase (NADH) small subunit